MLMALYQSVCLRRAKRRVEDFIEPRVSLFVVDELRHLIDRQRPVVSPSADQKQRILNLPNSTVLIPFKSLSLILLCVKAKQRMSHYSSETLAWSTTHLFLGKAFSLSSPLTCIWADQRSATAAVIKVNKYLLQFKDAAELRTRTQAVQEAPVDFQSEVLQFDTVTLIKQGH